MFCGERGTVLLIFTVGIALCAATTPLQLNDLPDAPGKGAAGGDGRRADTSSRLGTFGERRQAEKTRESADPASLAREWLESSSREVPRANALSRYSAGPNPEFLNKGLRQARATKGASGVPQLHIPPQWEHMRPVVECGSNMMMVTARRRGNAPLFIARENGPPISFFELPSNCGYSVKMTWEDFILKAPYDGCHVLKENGYYILPLLWWGTPVKVACPVKSAPTRSHVSVSCLPFGMSLRIKGQQAEANKLWIKLNGKWLPSVSAQCVHHPEASPGEVVLYLPYALCDLPLKDGVHTLSVLWNGSEQTVSCAATTHLQSPQHFALNYPFNYQPPHPSTPAPIHSTQYFERPYFYPMRPVPDSLAKLPGWTPKQTFNLPAHLPSGVYPVAKPHLPSKHHYFPMMHMFYPHLSTNILASPHHMLPMFYPYFHFSALPTSVSAASSPVSTTAEPLAVLNYIPPTPTIEPSTTLGYRPYIPIVCRQPTSTHGLYGDYDPYLSKYPQQIPAPYLDCTSQSFPSQSLTTQIPKRPQTVELVPSLTCLTNIMTIKLPSAHPNSLRVMGPDNWIPINMVPSSCAYKLTSGKRGVILSTPLPACHTRNLPSVRSFLLMFWDTILGRHRTLELRCPIRPSLNMQLVPTHPPIKTPVEPSPLQPPPLSPVVFCSAHNMRVELPPGPIWGISVKDGSGGAVRLKDAPKQCGYDVKKGKGGINTLVLPFGSCHMTLKGNKYKIHVRFRTRDGQEEESILSCPVNPLITKQECNFSIEKRIPCGPESCSQKECDSLGCCFCSSSGTCYYPMDECTVDHHFVFSVPASIMDPPLNPASLFVASNNSCTPQKVTSSFALFKLPLVGCGAHRYEIGQTVVYMLEILNTVRSITLGYGTITRDFPLRLLVECRFVPGSQVSVGYLVKTPSLGPSIQAQGTFGVQLRIATDEHYTSFYPQYHRPLRLLLGKPLHLEVRLLNPPDPHLVLLVHYCLAYPRSAQATWVLVYNGCPNSLDLAPKQPLPPPAPVPRQTRRFTITTFQFLSPDGHAQLDEEIYFMCSTEVCSPSEGPCVEGCFNGGEQSLASIKS